MEPKRKPKNITESPIKQREHLKISLILDDYNDIFSDFDPRPYNLKALSEDFLSEVKRRHIPEQKGRLEMRFIIPEKVRVRKIELMAKRRLRSYFQQESKSIQRLIHSRKRRGYAYILFGAVLLISVTFLGVTYPDNFWAAMAELLLTPPGWFGMWEGLGKVVERDENILKQLELSKRLSVSEYVFISESEALGN
ncbi:MAG: hypothetical protein ABIG39_02965 [Candidatus Micrarchaeota archaeon]